ncbi:MAG: rRNA maturation RNase YbeY [Betaproteobacteria bacterium]|nr:rRNA maturation RNase YbeY [Betaproteobacteria bacterium]
MIDPNNNRIDIQRISRLPKIPPNKDFLTWIQAALTKPAELTLRIVNAAEGRSLNADYRGKDYATNVLTFVYHERRDKTLLGDIVICAPVIAQEAQEQGKPLIAHYAHMTVHGVLHLAGFDHQTEPEAKKMEARETKILRTLGYPNPYTAA